MDIRGPHLLIRILWQRMLMLHQSLIQRLFHPLHRHHHHHHHHLHLMFLIPSQTELHFILKCTKEQPVV